MGSHSSRIWVLTQWANNQVSLHSNLLINSLGNHHMDNRIRDRVSMARIAAGIKQDSVASTTRKINSSSSSHSSSSLDRQGSLLPGLRRHNNLAPVTTLARAASAKWSSANTTIYSALKTYQLSTIRVHRNYKRSILISATSPTAS